MVCVPVKWHPNAYPHVRVPPPAAPACVPRRVIIVGVPVKLVIQVGFTGTVVDVVGVGVLLVVEVGVWVVAAALVEERVLALVVEVAGVRAEVGAGAVGRQARSATS